MSAPRPVPVVVAIDPGRFPEVVRALREAGLEVVSELPDLGSLTGTVRDDRLPGLESIDGVEAVERERGYRVPPPDSPVQ
ncbi:hypothetical protein LIX60_00135 [Streptomyces sp. S07_1.15]|uniref:hypothetical protein n=1 Tax=Streptomyces sp. S07_1.15 TaxID=2873925 RepID=UPI001D14AD53|nr:hypothetical protein [Streptomyces sp. S07_1.15]MCC3649927.1 hypothetical protein [Streptomyces sp. S07_1.15]